MMITPSYYWNVIHGGAPGEVTQDDEGMSVLKNLGNNMAWMIKVKDYSKNSFPVPGPMPREWTNFIR
jgi:hypothetical protein